MDRTELFELLAHYLVMLLLVAIALALLNFTVGELEFWVELLILMGVCLAYILLTVRLGVAPDMWNRQMNR